MAQPPGGTQEARRPSRLVIGVVAFVAVAVVALVLTRLGDGGTRTETTDTTPPSTTDGATTSVPPTTAPPTTTEPRPTTTEPRPTTTAPPTTQPSPATVVRRGPTASPVVALTFDAGSDAGATSRILDLLAARGATASFGLTGRWVEQHPGLSRRIVDEGHGVINHSQNHRSFTGFSTNTVPLTRAERVSEIRDAEDVIRAATGTDPRPWFRPPYGDYDDGVRVDVASAGYGYLIMWSIDSLGWQGIAPTEVAARTIAALEPGAIVLMHVGSASTDVDALPAVLDAIAQRGLEPVTIADLVGR